MTNNLLQPVELIKNKEQHAAYLEEVQKLMELDPAKGTPEGDRLGLLVLVIQDYENEHYPVAPLTFQQRVEPWLLECFGEMIAGDREERNHRFLEESLELVQSTGCTASEAHQLVDYVFGRPVGEPVQEVGGVMVTLAALCLANNMDMHQSGETELARINQPDIVLKIRAKQAAKPKHSPLPQATDPVQVTPTRKGGWYLQDKRGFIGNCMKFWYQSGYGAKLDKFYWIETKEKAIKTIGGCEWFEAWYAPYIDSISEKTVDMQLADRDQEKAMIQAAQEASQ